MKKVILSSLIVVFILSNIVTVKSQSQIHLKTKMDTISYIIGSNMGTQFKQNSLDLNLDILKASIESSMKGEKPMFPDSIVKKIMTRFQKEMMAKQDASKKEEAEKNIKIGDKFLSENKKKDGVITLPSGLQYKILKTGTGAKPKTTDDVKVNYEGKLIDGTIFDSSYQRNEPATFGVTQVIKGWTEALQLMPEGSIWELYIPADLAYGDRKAGNIPSGSTLIFKVELISIVAKDEKK